MKNYYVYILASKSKVLYIWITSNLIKRVFEHKEKIIEWFTKKYNVNRLVYYEMTNDVVSAIEREKRIKKWNREWKINLVIKDNPGWVDLYEEIL